uniref:Uncharacterized protein n=1 Tax=Thermocrispum agreste TaxID=37925 RepID=A0A2W4LBS7_9PSEU|nr:MAG: hypothetical protein DIU77_07875 [Thermocrispum agreste]
MGAGALPHDALAVVGRAFGPSLLDAGWQLLLPLLVPVLVLLLVLVLALVLLLLLGPLLVLLLVLGPLVVLVALVRLGVRAGLRGILQGLLEGVVRPPLDRPGFDLGHALIDAVDGGRAFGGRLLLAVGAVAVAFVRCWGFPGGVGCFRFGCHGRFTRGVWRGW